MKKFYILLAMTISLIIFLPTYNKHAYANAKTEYLRVIDNDTPFYKNIDDEETLFYLPFSYYVKIIGHSGDYYHVEIHGDNGHVAIDGYVPSDRLINDNLTVISPFLKLTITTANTAVLYGDKNTLEPLQYIFPERTLYYYGEILTEQGKLFYVAYNNRLGYVKETDIYPFIIQNHPNDLPSSSVDTPSEETKTPTEQNGVFGLRTIIIVCLIFAGIIAIFISLRSSRVKHKTTNYYDESDYE